MPSSPMLLNEHFMREAQPSEADIAEQIAPEVVEQLEMAVWGGAVYNHNNSIVTDHGSVTYSEQLALEATHSDSPLVKALNAKPFRSRGI